VNGLSFWERRRKPTRKERRALERQAEALDLLGRLLDGLSSREDKPPADLPLFALAQDGPDSAGDAQDRETDSDPAPGSPTRQARS
jgi:hypothetical protein